MSQTPGLTTGIAYAVGVGLATLTPLGNREAFKTVVTQETTTDNVINLILSLFFTYAGYKLMSDTDAFWTGIILIILGGFYLGLMLKTMRFGSAVGSTSE